MKLSQQVKPISYLKAHASEIVREICDDHKSVIITQNGEAKAIIQDLESYEKLQDSLAMLKILAQSQKSKTEGRYKTTSKAFRSIRSSVKTP
ncbi:MAG: type II toxin-antitoxin system Phd/YefM family antitoxin [Fibrobacterales bacterium]